MRFLKTIIPSVMAAVLLAGCAGTSSSGPSQLSPMAAHSGAMSQDLSGLRPILEYTNASPMVSCSSEFTNCFEVKYGSPFQSEWCISDSGSCSSGLVGLPQWTATVTNPKSGKPEKGLTAVWNPDPGNPSTLTITNHRKHCANPNRVKWVVTLSECDGSLGCNYFGAYGVKC